MIENIVIKSSDWFPSDTDVVFGGEEFQIVDAEDMQTLMLEIGAYPSKSQAMRAGRQGEIPAGYTEFKASKKMRIWIWNPRKDIS